MQSQSQSRTQTAENTNPFCVCISRVHWYFIIWNIFVLVGRCAGNFMVLSEVMKSCSLSLSFCGEAHTIPTTGYWFPLTVFWLELWTLLWAGAQGVLFVAGSSTGYWRNLTVKPQKVVKPTNLVETNLGINCFSYKASKDHFLSPESGLWDFRCKQHIWVIQQINRIIVVPVIKLNQFWYWIQTSQKDYVLRPFLHLY